MILRLTAKLGKAIDSMPMESFGPEENPFADWVGHWFTAGRVPYILMSNTSSLYSVILRGQGITSYRRFLEHSMESVRDFMCDDGLEFIFYRLIALQLGEIHRSKVNNRKIMSVIEDLTQRAQFLLTEQNLSPFDAACEINQTPLACLLDKSPREILTGMTPAGGIQGLVQLDQIEQEQKRQERLKEKAMEMWQSLPEMARKMLYNKARCPSCLIKTPIKDLDIQMEKRHLVLRGHCAQCGRDVERVIKGF
jgi:hypothetical protein